MVLITHPCECPQGGSAAIFGLVVVFEKDVFPEIGSGFLS